MVAMQGGRLCQLFVLELHRTLKRRREGAGLT
eukprot:CAMPEP_0205891300 /NCGR_PEP_ID=MMETSP1083-20121108/22014_1 /ASSEMBLY_ACC=CAM_ASM_000430 /TAXON_ID=97485 /ORGANISM="Prymnesium parvum, Strain Texoma1" /LENGTH=31 /DNA_ID= /DNA_START= /DNA_END= /DNA_ORIENTATION=